MTDDPATILRNLYHSMASTQRKRQEQYERAVKDQRKREKQHAKKQKEKAKHAQETIRIRDAIQRNPKNRDA